LRAPLRDAALRARPDSRRREGAAPRARDRGSLARAGRGAGSGDDLHLRERRGARAPAARACDRERRGDRGADRPCPPPARAGRRVRLRGRERRAGPGRGRAHGARPRASRRCRYHGAAMIHPRVDDLLQNVDSRYALVIVAAKRARQINNYHHQLGEGTFDDNPPPLVESRSKNYLTMAMEEVAEGLLSYEYPK